MTAYLHHEKLIVYQRSIDFVAWSEELVEGITRKASAKEQLRRASASIPQNIAESNAKRTAREQRRFVDIANGSALESAACLDVLRAKELIAQEVQITGKQQLHEIVSMLYGLRRSKQDRVAEDSPHYGTFLFDHEKLHAYQKAIELVAWIDMLCRDSRISAESMEVLDRTSTSVALNIAEGNAKFSAKERCRFIDTSVSASLRCAGALDVLVARKGVSLDRINAGKELLGTVVSLLIGLRGRLLRDEPDWET